MASLFGPSPEEIMFARQQQMQEQQMMRQRQMAQQGQQFGIFAPLYQAGLQLGDVGAQAAMQSLFPQQADPALQRAVQTRSIYNEVMKDFDPEDPSKSLTTLAKRFTEAGLAEPAMMAAQEAAKYGSQRRAEKRAEYRDDPYAMIEDAMALPEDDPKRTSMLNRASRAISKENYDIAIREAKLKEATENKEKGRISTLYQTEDGKPLTERPDGTLVTQDGRRYMGKTKIISRAQSPYAGFLGGNTGEQGAAATPSGVRSLADLMKSVSGQK
jgi:hypothetical protein